ncbi:unnamed protein product [Amoebophrya sp. A25]|nr:unnamed protein product [Amoebophrya sp. A25]|eukprot:GSA25T00000958001.1
MGAAAYLPVANTHKETAHGCGKGGRWGYGVCAMQGWRRTMEDAHLHIPDFAEDLGLFGVFDGHGGSAVSKLVAQKFPAILKKQAAFVEENYAEALKAAFIEMDIYLDSDEGRTELLKIGHEDDEPPPPKGNGQATSLQEFLRTTTLIGEDGEEIDASELLQSANYLSFDGDDEGDKKETKEGDEKLSGDGAEPEPAKDAKGDTAAKEHTLSTSEEEYDVLTAQPDVLTAQPSPAVAAPAGSVQVGGSSSSTSNAAANVGAEKDYEVAQKKAASSSEEAKNGEATASTAVLDASQSPAVGAPPNGGIQSKEALPNGGDKAEDGARKGEEPASGAPSSSIARGIEAAADGGSVLGPALPAAPAALIGPAVGPAKTIDDLPGSVADLPKSEADELDELFKAVPDLSGGVPFSNIPLDEQAAEYDREDDKESGSSSSGDGMDDIEDLEERMFRHRVNPESQGCTANVILLQYIPSTGKYRVFCANCGDSRSVLCRQGVGMGLCEDHKPYNREEYERIVAAGGQVLGEYPGRVDGNLNLSRAMGDLSYKDMKNSPECQKICVVPDISITDLQDTDNYIVMGCDGIFEKNSNEELVAWLNQRMHDHVAAKEVESAENLNLSAVSGEFLDFNLAPSPGMSENGAGCDNMSMMIVRAVPGAPLLVAEKNEVSDRSTTEGAEQENAAEQGNAKQRHPNVEEAASSPRPEPKKRKTEGEQAVEEAPLAAAEATA